VGGVREIVLLTLGWEELPKSVSVYGAPAHERLREPVPGILLRCDGGWLLLDTGINTALIREPIEEALDAAGIDLADIHAAGLSHLHLDHAGGLKLFAGRVPVHAQRRELEYGLSDHPDPERHAIYRVDFDDPAHDWRLAEGDTEIAPGVTAVLTAGHTPGHQSFVVDLDDSIGGGGYVFAFDAADLTENIEHELPIGGTVGVHPRETVGPIRRLKALAAEKGYPLVPGHDPVVWPELTARLADRFARTTG
jgi:glyoxylase-like metal-dependent hydrolase (beta-lactamase superfamily II)